MEDWEVRAALDAHWAASDANDFELEHQIYREDAVLEYPQSGERIRGRRNIQASRAAQPSLKRFTVRRIHGAAGLWVTEFVLTYDGRALRPSAPRSEAPPCRFCRQWPPAGAGRLPCRVPGKTKCRHQSEWA